MEITAKPVSVEHLVALIEARQFPIGVDFADPLAQRLYDAMSVLMCQASIAARRASIARRYIKDAMRNMEVAEEFCSYPLLKECLEEMNAQGQSETADVVLCKQYREELNDVIPAAKVVAAGLRDFAANLSSVMPELTAAPGLETYAKQLWWHGEALIGLLRDGAEQLDHLMTFATPTVLPGSGQ
ncbi:MAG: hypothetical protein ACRCWH_21455 [Aeromonas veronii]